MTLLTVAADYHAAVDVDQKACCRWAVQQSIDIACRLGPQQQTRRMLLTLSTDGTDRQTYA